MEPNLNCTNSNPYLCSLSENLMMGVLCVLFWEWQRRKKGKRNQHQNGSVSVTNVTELSCGRKWWWRERDEDFFHLVYSRRTMKRVSPWQVEHLDSSSRHHHLDVDTALAVSPLTFCGSWTWTNATAAMIRLHNNLWKIAISFVGWKWCFKEETTVFLF